LREAVLSTVYRTLSTVYRTFHLALSGMFAGTDPAGSAEYAPFGGLVPLYYGLAAFFGGGLWNSLAFIISAARGGEHPLCPAGS
jgi:hypothetical protein